MARNTIDYVADWSARLRTRLYTQFRDKATWTKWTDLVLGPQFQDLEDSAQTLLTFFDIDNSEGAQLDLIGRYVGQSRLGTGDPTYRLYLKARILADRSTGTPEELYAVLRMLFGAGMIYLPGIVKQFALRVTSAITAAQAVVGLAFLSISKEGGARGIFEWQESADAEMFYTASPTVGATTLAAAATAGVTSQLRITDASNWTSDGVIVLGKDTALEEFIVYANRVFTAGIWFVDLVSPPTVNKDHANGSAAEIQSGDGLGFGDVNSTTLGGNLAGATEA